MANKLNENIEYTRNLYQNVLDWYKNADSKAQVILAIDGGLVAFISSTAFYSPEEIRVILKEFTPITSIFLTFMFASLLASMGSAILCLWSRIYSADDLKIIIDNAISKAKNSEFSNYPYPPSVSCFFQFIERLEKEKFRETLNSVDIVFETKALSNQIYILSGNVRRKHYYVNLGFMFSLAALIFFFLSSISYVLRFV